MLINVNLQFLRSSSQWGYEFMNSTDLGTGIMFWFMYPEL